MRIAVYPVFGLIAVVDANDANGAFAAYSESYRARNDGNEPPETIEALHFLEIRQDDDVDVLSDYFTSGRDDWPFEDSQSLVPGPVPAFADGVR